MPLPFSVEALLDAIDGFAYVADGAGIICGFSRGKNFAEPDAEPDDDSATHWHVGEVTGRNLFALIDGDAVRESYRTLHRAIWSGCRPSVGFEYRCDAPAIERHMRMSLSLVRAGATPAAVLYQSTIITETPRLPLPLFAADMLAHRRPNYSPEQIITLCSYCHSVAWPPGQAAAVPEWIEAAEFYRRGGPADIGVSHSVCRPCYERIVLPSELSLRSAGGACETRT